MVRQGEESRAGQFPAHPQSLERIIVISSFSSNGANCIDVQSQEPDIITITETDDSINSGTVFTNRANFEAFIVGVKAGEFDHLVATPEHV